jgi:hypothetical protein
MSRIAAWGKNKPLLPAIIAQIIAITPQILTKYLDVVRECKELPDIPLPDSKLWLSFYRNNKHLTTKVLSDMFESGFTSKMKKNLSDYSEAIKKLPSDTEIDRQFKSRVTKQMKRMQKERIENGLAAKIVPQELAALIGPIEFFKISSELSSDKHPLLAEIHNFTLKLIEDDIEDEKKPEIYSTEDDQKTFTPEILFFLKVLFPCWILYNEHPTFLLRKARQGDIDSLGKLLRLDKTLIKDRLISEQIIRSRSSAPNKFLILTKAIEDSPKEQKSIQRIKYSLAGLISIISEDLGHKFTAPEIKQLFDAVAVDYDRDELIDPDLPDSPESFNKAIQRARPFWLH